MTQAQIVISRSNLATTVAVLAAFGLSGAAAAQTTDPTWKVSGSFRVRYEALSNQVRPTFNENEDVVSLRTTLFAERKSGPLRLGAEMYDSRVYGANRRSPVTTSEVNTFEMVQAYAALDLNPEGLGKTTIQAGRMMLNLGSRRLVAADDYRNTTNSYTGLRINTTPLGIKATLLYVQPQLRLPDGQASVLDNAQRIDHQGRDLELFGFIAAKPKAFGATTVEVAYFGVKERDRPGRPTRDRDLDTVSGRLLLDPKPGRFDYELEAIGQTGTISAGLGANDATLKVRAGFVHADAGYTFVQDWKPRLSVELDAATGDKPGGRYGRFDTLFGMRRADLGPSGIYAAIGRTNLVTPGVRLEVVPGPAWEAFASVRGLWLAAKEDAFATTNVRDASGRSGRYAGVQAEGRVRYWIIKDRLRAEVNAAWLDKGRFLTTAPNAPRSGDEAYTSLNLTATF